MSKPGGGSGERGRQEGVKPPFWGPLRGSMEVCRSIGGAKGPPDAAAPGNARIKP